MSTINKPSVTLQDAHTFKTTFPKNDSLQPQKSKMSGDEQQFGKCVECRDTTKCVLVKTNISHGPNHNFRPLQTGNYVAHAHRK